MVKKIKPEIIPEWDGLDPGKTFSIGTPHPEMPRPLSEVEKKINEIISVVNKLEKRMGIK